MGEEASSIRRDKAFDLLVVCADWPRTDRQRARIHDAFASLGGDWDSFLGEVDRHQLTVHAFDSLRDAGIELPENLSRRADMARMRGLALSGEAVRMTDALKQAGIRAVVLKGPLLSQTLYGDPTVRQSVDLDLLVGWNDFRDARYALEEFGYSLLGNEPPWDDWRIDRWRRMAKDLTLVNRQKRFALELHHRLKSPAALLPDLGLEQATHAETLAGRSLATFSTQDLFVYLCTHAATSLWDRLKWLADIRALLADKDVQEIERLQAHSQRNGTERCTALGLALCQRLWNQPLPSSLEELCKSDPELSRLIDAAWKRLRGPERHHSSFANSLQRRHLVHLRDDPAYRRAMSAEFFYDREILERFKLPHALRGLYLFLRIGVFMRRKLELLRASRRIPASAQSSIRQNRPA
ncbi:MAG: nucleotidyltransferase family protein [Erythrobacter sp.]|nr:nucleotidyltransferase family protein [Erythrobacter sp.]